MSGGFLEEGQSGGKFHFIPLLVAYREIGLSI